MDAELTAVPFTFQGRMSRSKSRLARDQVAQARVTQSEHEELLGAARGDGRALGEWIREVLLREARRAETDMLFTELIATRMLLVNLIKPILEGKTAQKDYVAEAMTEIRRVKRKAAKDVRQQYRDEDEGGR